MTTLPRFPVQEMTLSLLHASLASKARWHMSFWDAAIVEAARALECNLLYSEDLQHGQGLKVSVS